MIAVVEVNGKQYSVTPGELLEVEKMEGDVGDKVTLDKVLLVDDSGKVEVGTPTVAGWAVTAKISAQIKGEKLTVRRYKQKVRYRRTKGFRPQLTTLEILTIKKA